MKQQPFIINFIWNGAFKPRLIKPSLIFALHPAKQHKYNWYARGVAVTMHVCDVNAKHGTTCYLFNILSRNVTTSFDESNCDSLAYEISLHLIIGFKLWLYN